MDMKLVVVKGKTSVKEIPLNNARMSIGRKSDCTVRIPSPMVSRQHCELVQEEGRILVKDLGSSNGTFVNGARVKQRELKAGDTLGVGPITFVLEVQGERSQAASDEPADFVIGALVEEDGEAADFVDEPVADDEADFVIGSEASSDASVEEAPAEADFVVNDEAADGDADFVLGDQPAGESGDGFVRSDIEEATSGEATSQTVGAAAAEPPESSGQPEKKGRFGWFSKRKSKKEEPKPSTPPAAAPTPPAKAPPAPKRAEAPAPEFAAGTDPPKPRADSEAEEEDLANFLMGLNEKDE